ncbi:MAG: hypothetical protein ABJC09_11980 [Terriglobia bacterium]
MGDFTTKNAGGVTFSEPHAAAFADKDGAVLYWYLTVRNPRAEGGAEFVPELIHNRSGVGSQFVVKDINNDGSPAVVTSGVKGTFIFWNQMRASTPSKQK